jgi:hypothetical protein
MQHAPRSTSRDARKATFNSAGARHLVRRDRDSIYSGFGDDLCGLYHAASHRIRRGCCVQNGQPWSCENASEHVSAGRTTADDASNVSRCNPERRHDQRKGHLSVSRVIWDRAGNPTRYVSDQLGITRVQLHVALHKIKAYSNLGATDRTVIYDDGSLTDENGDYIGNIHDEVTGR